MITTLTATVTTGDNVAYAWAFGDGWVSTAKSGVGAVVTHAYATLGDYTAVITASNSVNTLTATTHISIILPIGPRTVYLPLVLKAP